MSKIKLLGLSILTIIFMMFSSCSKDDDVSGDSGAIVEVTVKYKGVKQKNYPVNMFDVKKGPSSKFFTNFFADKTVVTNNNGIAIFKLQDVYDLDAISNQTTLYFAVFSKQGNAHTAVTIEKGETKSVIIILD